MDLEHIKRMKAQLERQWASKWFPRLNDEEFKAVSDLKKAVEKNRNGRCISWRTLRECMEQECPEVFN